MVGTVASPLSSASTTYDANYTRLSNDRPVHIPDEGIAASPVPPRAHTVHPNDGLKTLYLIGRVPDRLPPDRDASRRIGLPDDAGRTEAAHRSVNDVPCVFSVHLHSWRRRCGDSHEEEAVGRQPRQVPRGARQTRRSHSNSAACPASRAQSYDDSHCSSRPDPALYEFTNDN